MACPMSARHRQTHCGCPTNKKPQQLGSYWGIVLAEQAGFEPAEGY